MSHYTYLIVGGGMTADAAAEGIRQADPAGTIGLIGSEPHPPYDRPPLSKGLWKGDPLEKIWRGTESKGVVLHVGREARSLDPRNKQVVDDQGGVYTFDKLLLATGGTPRQLAFGAGRILYFRTLDDYGHLRGLTEKGRRFAVIGGGFIGSEIAAALAMNGKEVVMALSEGTLGGRVFPRDLGLFLNDFYRQKGIEVLAEATAVGLEPRGDQVALRIRGVKDSSDREVVLDGVAAGIGIQPNVELAGMAGLEVGNGILVDQFLRTNHPDIFSAGDVASFYNPALGKRIRVEHEDNALTMGRLAGRNMAGELEPYHHLPFFYSDLFELGYEAVGELDARLETVADWRDPFKEGVVYYLSEGRVRGVLLWNVWERVGAARALIAEPGPFRAEDLKGAIK